jgi:FHA domain
MTLLHISIQNGAAFKHALTRDKTVFGRGKECDVVVTENSVSKQHFAIESILGDFFVYDLGSKNGTFLNGERLVGKQLLRENNIIEAGLLEARFMSETALDASSSADFIIHTSGLCPTLTIISSVGEGTCFTVTKRLTTLGKRNQQVAILQQRQSGLFLTHLEGVSTLLNDQAIGSNSLKLKRGDVIDICNTQLKVDFVKIMNSDPSSTRS